MPCIVIGVPPAEFGILAVPFNAWTTTENRAMRELGAKLTWRIGYPAAFSRSLISHRSIIPHTPTRPGRPPLHQPPAHALLRAGYRRRGHNLKALARLKSIRGTDQPLNQQHMANIASGEAPITILRKHSKRHSVIHPHESRTNNTPPAS